AGVGRYPATPGAFQTVFQGGDGTLAPINRSFDCDVAISKYDSSGQNLIWASYLGGTVHEYPYSLVVDENEQLVVLGTTYSDDFPMVASGYQTQYQGKLDLFLVKFGKDGDLLKGATFIGGSEADGLVDQGGLVPRKTTLVYNYADNFRGEVLIDSFGGIYVVATTSSPDF